MEGLEPPWPHHDCSPQLEFRIIIKNLNVSCVVGPQELQQNRKSKRIIARGTLAIVSLASNA